MNGYTTLTPTQTLIGTAVVFRAGVPWAVSRGGVRVEFDRELREVEFDGRRAPVAGLDRVVGHGVRITGTFLELSIAQAQRYELGVTGVLASGITTITPRDADDTLPSGAYVANVLCVVKRADGTLVGVRMPKVIPTYSLEGEDRSEAGIITQMEARVDYGVGGLTEVDAPYTIEFDTSGIIAPPPTGVIDEFVAANGTNLNGRIADTGQMWTALRGSWDIQSNKARISAIDGSSNFAVVETGESDVFVEAQISTRGDNPRVVARCLNENNLLMVNAGTSTGVSMYKRVAGTYTELDNASYSLASNDVLALDAQGTALRGLVNGAELMTATDAAHLTETKCGLGGVDGLERFERFEVTV